MFLLLSVTLNFRGCRGRWAGDLFLFFCCATVLGPRVCARPRWWDSVGWGRWCSAANKSENLHCCFFLLSGKYFGTRKRKILWWGKSNRRGRWQHTWILRGHSQLGPFLGVVERVEAMLLLLCLLGWWSRWLEVTWSYDLKYRTYLKAYLVLIVPCYATVLAQKFTGAGIGSVCGGQERSCCRT